MDISFSYKGSVEKRVPLSSDSTSFEELRLLALDAFFCEEATNGIDYKVKLLHKGKVIQPGDIIKFSDKKLPFKVVVLATKLDVVHDVQAKRSDPTIRGFDQEKKKLDQLKQSHQTSNIWGEGAAQNKEYKFCRFEACTWQSFGHRATDSTPHAFKAIEILEKLATDPGVVSIMLERKLVVGTLGEMDPIDDRLMKKTAGHGGCLLGYNTNMGTRIDLKLRTDDLRRFRPYAEVVSILIHELSHNWVGEHNALFWANFAQMRVEYLHKHASLSSAGYIVNGRTTAHIADVDTICKNGLHSIEKHVIRECARDMAQHNLDVSLVIPSIRARCQELLVEKNKSEMRNCTTATESSEVSNRSQERLSKRELALAAAERRATDDKRKSSRDETNIDK